MGRQVLKYIGVGLLILWACGCAQDQELKKQVADLKTQVTELQTTLADLNLRMEEMNSSMFVLRESAKNNREAIKKLQEELQKPTVYIQQPPESKQFPSYQPTKEFTDNKPETFAPLPTGTGTPSGDADQAFKSAMIQLQNGNWGLAIYDLNAFIVQHPGSSYIPRARYALGEAYRNLSEFSQAVREYERCLAAGAVAGPYAPRALYWIGVSYQKLGQEEKSKQAFERLSREYPESPEAKQLKQESPR